MSREKKRNEKTTKFAKKYLRFGKEGDKKKKKKKGCQIFSIFIFPLLWWKHIIKNVKDIFEKIRGLKI